MSGVSLGTVTIKSNIAGTEIEFPVDLTLDIKTSPAGVDLNVFAKVGLAKLQENFDAIAKTFPMPNDDSGYGTKILAHLDSASLTSSGDTATVHANVNVDIWHIEKGIPLGGTTIRWENRCVNFPFIGDVCSNVPVTVEPLPGDDVKTNLLEEDIVGEIGLVLLTPDNQSVLVHPTKVDVKPRGDVGRFFNDIAGIFNYSLGDVARREISEIVNDGTLRQTLPQEILAYNPSIRAVQFNTSVDGNLEAHINFYALLTPEQLTEWISASIIN